MKPYLFVVDIFFKKNLEIFKIGVPKGIRTPVSAVKGRCPRPG